ncbi:MAG TPA: acyl-CoA dehydrogenase family protein [Gammaproteobacteria bacterium]
MDFEHSPRVRDLAVRVTRFMQEQVYPAEAAYFEHVEQAADRWTIPPLMEELKAKAQAEGLWNLFLAEFEDFGYGLSNLEYAPLAEIMGRSLIGAECFNCSAPDTGNMEVLARFGTPAQQQRWLKPLLAGEIRSAFAMTEPGVASSDATNVKCSITRDGDDYVIEGRKWWITGAPDPRCKILIVMGKTDPDGADRHRQQSQVLVPFDTPGVKLLRPLTVYGYDDAPHGHAELVFDHVRVPVSNLLANEGDGFAIAQARLGPGRIHHCMRLVGCAQRALELMCRRAESRVAFGKKLSEMGPVREAIAQSACEIEQARLLTLQAADRMDRAGYKEARDLIGMIKIVAPQMAQTVIDRAIQLHGAAGLSEDLFLARAFSYARYCRIADGPDAVHLASLGKQLIRRHAPAEA